MFKGIDNTFSTGELIFAFKNSWKCMKPEFKVALVNQYDEFNKQLNESWLINLLCQYSSNQTVNFYDASYYGILKRTIASGNLYLSIIELEDWAFSDNELDKNENNLRRAGLNVISTGKKNSDGFFGIEGEFNMTKVYMNEQEEPKDLEQITISNLHGTIEYGTQTFCKSVFNIYTNGALCRVPYKNDVLFRLFKKPVAAIFLNINKPKMDFFL